MRTVDTAGNYMPQATTSSSSQMTDPRSVGGSGYVPSGTTQVDDRPQSITPGSTTSQRRALFAEIARGSRRRDRRLGSPFTEAERAARRAARRAAGNERLQRATQIKAESVNSMRQRAEDHRVRAQNAATQAAASQTSSSSRTASQGGARPAAQSAATQTATRRPTSSGGVRGLGVLMQRRPTNSRAPSPGGTRGMAGRITAATRRR